MKSKIHWKRANRTPYLQVYEQYVQGKPLLRFDKRTKPINNQPELPNLNTGDSVRNPSPPTQAMGDRFPFNG
ncbi:MAG: hypothetical protein HN531_05475 [Opitutae bacterium]|nr:hypothetical protein [Opitutae bacterium]